MFTDVSVLAANFFLIASFAYSSTMKMEAIYSSEMLINFYQTISFARINALYRYTFCRLHTVTYQKTTTLHY
jgi:hypothetical protein